MNRYSKAHIAASKNKKGGSNVGKYTKDNIFAGPSGGAPAGSFPITKNGKSINKDRVMAAVKLSHNAPNPRGLLLGIIKELEKQGKNKLATQIRGRM